jgi:transposase-like protein
MPIFLFNDGSVEIACPRCDSTSPRTTAWVHANDRYNCPACNTEITLDQDRQLAELGEPNAIRLITTGSSGSS